MIAQTDPFTPASEPMHAKSAKARSAYLSMLSKDNESHRAITDNYVRFWEEGGHEKANTEEEVAARKDSYMSLVNNYYDLATDLYEEAWGQYFHFCRFAIGESMPKALARHEHYLAHMMDLKAGMKVLDVGCGVGGPAREIATFIGCDIVGVNNNGYQIQKAITHSKAQDLSHKASFAKGDFMHLDFPENSFDAVYAIEATVHAPSLQGVYEQIYRVLKPGGTFGVYEWVMTDKYDESNAKHCEMRLGIERGNGIANMMPRRHAVEAIQAAGFTLEHEEDLADRGDAIPWYAPLAGDLRFVTTLWEYLPALRMTKIGRTAASSLLRGLEKIRLAPSGTADTADELARGADNLVAGGREGLFTPMYLMVAKKPVA